MPSKSQGLLEGWPLVGWAALAIFLAILVMIAASTSLVDSAHAVMRLTARTSFALFLLAFTASAAWRFWPGPWTRWQRQNRRYIGVSFAVSHALHLAALVLLMWIAPADLADVAAATWIFGGIAYAFIAVMTLTSFDRAARMLGRTFGPRAWTILHTSGAYYVWFIFLNSFLSRAWTMPEYVPVAALGIAALGLRIAARIAQSRTARPAIAA